MLIGLTMAGCLLLVKSLSNKQQRPGDVMVGQTVKRFPEV